jgi:hypothetical protein
MFNQLRIMAESTKMKLYNLHKNIKFKVINELENGVLQNVDDKMLSQVRTQNF